MCVHSYFTVVLPEVVYILHTVITVYINTPVKRMVGGDLPAVLAPVKQYLYGLIQLCVNYPDYKSASV